MTPDQVWLDDLQARLKEAQGSISAEEFDRAREQSVVQQPYAQRNGIATWSAVQSPVGPILPPWATRRREWALRVWDRHEYNTLWQGAQNALGMRIAATPWVIDGGKILANKYQRIFRSAASGEWIGWDTWVRSVFREFTRQDGGAWIEVVGPGNPLGELTGGVTGLNVLSSYNCWPTGDPEYPCVYFSRLGRYNLMHRSRVIHLVDMPDSDVLNPGYGLCALSRCIAVVQRQFYEQRYIAENLNDIPSSGVVIAENLTPEKVQEAYAAMQARVDADQPGQPGNVVWLFSMNPTAKADLKTVTFSRPPEKFDWDTYVRIDVNMMALAIGEDPQDLWPLSSSSMGSGMQSEILAKKGKGKMYGSFLKLLERELNSILPESLEFSFKIVDPDSEKKEAEVAAAWAGALVQIGPRMSDAEGRRLLADTSEAIYDIVTDEKGEMVELQDVDVQPVNAGGIAPVSNPALPPTTQQAAQPATSAGDATTNSGAVSAVPTSAAQKDFDATRSRFVANLTDLIHAGDDGDLNRRRAGIVMRGQLNSAGLAARKDGLAEGGVSALSDADFAAHAAWLTEQSSYVTPFLNDLYKQGLSDAEIDAHAQAWANKSLQLAYFQGLESADADGVYEFFGTDGKESCIDCRSLQGVKMRMSDWTKQQKRPGVDTQNFECGGYQCKHGLRRVSAG